MGVGTDFAAEAAAAGLAGAATAALAAGGFGSETFFFLNIEEATMEVGSLSDVVPLQTSSPSLAYNTTTVPHFVLRFVHPTDISMYPAKSDCVSTNDANAYPSQKMEAGMQATHLLTTACRGPCRSSRPTSSSREANAVDI